MSESHDQSYYEIALTNRQVMSIFVVLLVCFLVSFLGGVWLGRDSGATVEMASTQAIVAGEVQDAPLEPLDFFNRPSSTDDAPGRASEAAASAGVAPSRSGEPNAKRAEKASPRTGDPAKTTAKPAARATPKPLTAEAEPQPKAEPKPKVLPQSGPVERESPQLAGVRAVEAIPSSVVIQVFSSNEEAQAIRVADQLRKSGYPAILSPVEVAGRTLHRVRIGPYSDADEAQVVAESVRRAFKFDTWITH